MTNVRNVAHFYEDAAQGQLPEFSMINPTCCNVGTNAMHPTGLVYDGECLRLYMMRSGLARSGMRHSSSFPSINTVASSTMFPPPLATRPDNANFTELAPDGIEHSIYLDRLGARVPTFLLSPWVQQGYVENGVPSIIKGI